MAVSHVSRELFALGNKKYLKKMCKGDKNDASSEIIILISKYIFRNTS